MYNRQAKTTTALMYFDTLKNDSMLVKRINFSSATTSGMFQASSWCRIQGGNIDAEWADRQTRVGVMFAANSVLEQPLNVYENNELYCCTTLYENVNIEL